MKNNYEGLYVLDFIEPIYFFEDNNCYIEEAEVLRNRICRKEIVIIDDETFVFYRDLEWNRIFKVEDKVGSPRIDESTIMSLREYYNCLGLPRITGLDNERSVRGKVKTLKRENKI